MAKKIKAPSKKELELVEQEAFLDRMLLLMERKRELSKEVRCLDKDLKELKQEVQLKYGKPELVDQPMVTRVGRYMLTQILRHQEVAAHEKNFVDFDLVEVR